jgi:hypothetical protein
MTKAYGFGILSSRISTTPHTSKTNGEDKDDSEQTSDSSSPSCSRAEGVGVPGEALGRDSPFTPAALMKANFE